MTVRRACHKPLLALIESLRHLIADHLARGTLGDLDNARTTSLFDVCSLVIVVVVVAVQQLVLYVMYAYGAAKSRLARACIANPESRASKPLPNGKVNYLTKSKW